MILTRRSANFLLLMVSAIWGLAFVAQRMGMDHMGPFAFNAVRFAVGSVFLLPFLVFGIPGTRRMPLVTGSGRDLVLGGLLVGALIFTGSTFQQFGVAHTSAGKAGFITGLYVVFVPLLGLVRGLRTRPVVWCGVVLAAVGLYLLSGEGLSGEGLGRAGLLRIGLGDGLVLAGAVFWALHVLGVGRYANRTNPLALAVIQFALCSLLVAFTLQIVGQRRAHPAYAALVLSLEGVFAAVGGWVLLGETLTDTGLLGCALMLGGTILAQVEPRGGK
ncbi:EamA family transporter [bacterium DOLJORAL78_65_58]|nr:MAG: EamA family transporter [bacterium DOLJORAL78_65_58]